MSGHNIVQQLLESAGVAGGRDLVAPLLAVGNGVPANSGASKVDAYLYLRLDGSAADEMLYVNTQAGGSNDSAWAALTN